MCRGGCSRALVFVPEDLAEGVLLVTTLSLTGLQSESSPQPAALLGAQGVGLMARLAAPGPYELISVPSTALYVLL